MRNLKVQHTHTHTDALLRDQITKQGIRLLLLLLLSTCIIEFHDVSTTTRCFSKVCCPNLLGALVKVQTNTHKKLAQLHTRNTIGEYQLTKKCTTGTLDTPASFLIVCWWRTSGNIAEGKLGQLCLALCASLRYPDTQGHSTLDPPVPRSSLNSWSTTSHISISPWTPHVPHPHSQEPKMLDKLLTTKIYPAIQDRGIIFFAVCQWQGSNVPSLYILFGCFSFIPYELEVKPWISLMHKIELFRLVPLGPKMFMSISSRMFWQFQMLGTALSIFLRQQCFRSSWWKCQPFVSYEHVEQSKKLKAEVPDVVIEWPNWAGRNFPLRRTVRQSKEGKIRVLDTITQEVHALGDKSSWGLEEYLVFTGWAALNTV